MKKVLLVVAVLLVGVLGFVLSRSSTYVVERKQSIAAPADFVFSQVNDFHNWPNWSPWEKLDPQMKRTYEGAQAGVGAAYSWDSPKDDVGAGKMTITEAKPAEKIQIKLEFLRPFAATSPTTFSFAPKGEQTEVTWHMEGGGGFMGKVMNAFMNMDAAVGKDFEKGLTNMKTFAEAEAKKAPPPPPAAAN